MRNDYHGTALARSLRLASTREISANGPRVLLGTIHRPTPLLSPNRSPPRPGSGAVRVALRPLLYCFVNVAVSLFWEPVSLRVFPSIAKGIM